MITESVEGFGRERNIEILAKIERIRESESMYAVLRRREKHRDRSEKFQRQRVVEKKCKLEM
jgi:hypothetical protein